MSEASYYEINVSLNGCHFFATTKRSATNVKTARRIFYELKKRFPEKDGFKITITGQVEYGEELDW